MKPGNIRSVVLGTAALALLAWGAPVSAEPVAVEAPGVCAPASLLSPLDGALPAAGVSCTADCADGSSVTRTCPDSCTAVHQTCNPQSGGYVECGDGTRQYCSACPGVPSCESLHYTPCSGFGNSIQCVWSSGKPSTCACLSGLWRCIR